MGGRNIKVASSVRFFAVLAGREHNDADAVGIPVSLLAGILGSLNVKAERSRSTLPNSHSSQPSTGLAVLHISGARTTRCTPLRSRPML